MISSEIADPALAAALHEPPIMDDVVWLARIVIHSAGASNVTTAAAASLALASAARRRGEYPSVPYGRELSDRATTTLLARAERPVADSVAALLAE